MRNDSLKNLLYAAAIAAMLMLTTAVGVGTWLGYRWFADTHLPSVGKDGEVRAKVVRATLFARNDLRVGRLSGTIQGVGRASRLWGWLNSSQVVLAPFTVDYFIPLSKLRPSDIMMDKNGRQFLIHAPEIYADQPNIDMAKASLNNVSGVFVTRGAYSEMAGNAAGSAQQVAAERAQAAPNIATNREFARRDLTQLFEGALRATGVEARVVVIFPGENPSSNEHWDVSRSIEQVMRDFPDKS